MSRLGKFCDRFIETGWLSAVALIPLYVNFFSFRGHSVGKAYLLQALVLLMAVAWVIKLAEGAADRGLRSALAALWKNPLAVPVAAYVLVLFATTAASIAPALSLHGSFGWLQGTSTTLTYIAFFCLMVLNLRGQEQFDRIISVLLLTSIPVALYALCQEFGMDPLSHLGTRATLHWAARSTLGNHIFLGAYLIMVMPWTAARLIKTVEDSVESPPPASWGVVFLGVGSILLQNLLLAVFLVLGSINWRIWWATLPVLLSYLSLALWTARLRRKLPPLAAVAGYSFLFSLQAIALLFTQARGPWVGALAGALVFGLLIALRRRQRRLFAGVVGLSLAVALFAAILNIPQGPLEPLRRYVFLGRLGSLSESDSGSVRFRLNMWGTMGRLLSTWPEIAPSSGWLAPVRPLVGYGPETLSISSEKVLAPALGREETWLTDHGQAHNDFLQHFAEMGLLGLTAFVIIVVAFYRTSLKSLWKSADKTHQLYTVAIVTAVTAHLIELQFGVAVTATRMLFWAFLALAIFLNKPPMEEQTETPREEGPLRRRWLILGGAFMLFLVAVAAVKIKAQAAETGLILGFGGMLVGMMLMTLAFGPSGEERRARWRNWWIYITAVVVVGVYLYQNSFQPLLAHAFFWQGMIAEQRQQPLPGALAYQQAVSANPSEEIYHAALGKALAQVGFLLLKENNNSKPPEEFKPTALLARTIGPEALVKLGGEGVLALAEAALQEARRIQPLNPRRVFELGQLNHYWGVEGKPERLDAALRYYEETAQMSPARLLVFVEWAMAHLAKHQWMEALKRIEAARAAGHESWLIHYVLALTHQQLGDKKRALEEAEIAARKSRSGEERPLQLLKELGS